MKQGLLFEQVVADIVRSFDKTVEVRQGQWVIGPDGRRDRDVSFIGRDRDSRAVKVLIECKDYNPNTTGPVGIGMVDALESKRRDLRIDIPIICSNAGFTKPAIAKARRVGIGLVGALKASDRRIRFQVYDVAYTRKLTVPPPEIRVHVDFPEGYVPNADSKAAPLESWTRDGLYVSNWATERINRALLVNPIVNGYLYLKYKMRIPCELQYPGGTVQADTIRIECRVTGAWYRHDALIEATDGFYDWVRKRGRLANTSPRVFRQTLDVHGGVMVKRPPDYVLNPPSYEYAEVDLKIAKIYGPRLTGPAPLLDPFIEPSDLDPRIHPLEPAAYTSTPGFLPEAQ
ncbi:MAG TPA: restriction endonuclease [Steroidobacteraceae bacterium]|jgi:hypothetical protein